MEKLQPVVVENDDGTPGEMERVGALGTTKSPSISSFESKLLDEEEEDESISFSFFGGMLK